MDSNLNTIYKLKNKKNFQNIRVSFPLIIPNSEGISISFYENLQSTSLIEQSRSGLYINIGFIHILKFNHENF